MAATAATDLLPPEAYAAALAGLPGMGPARLHALLGCSTPAAAWRAVADGSLVSGGPLPAVLRAAGVSLGLAERWHADAIALDPAERWAAIGRAGVGAAVIGSPGFPAALAGDVEPPAVVFHRGDLDRLAGPRVAIVGTRTCTRYGRDIAFDLGRDLAAAGIGVVSGLALGVDGAAHAGAIDAGGGPPIAVVGSGLDVVYPRAHRELWRRVEQVGVVLSEAPLGSPPEPWRFPARNRVIAALADVVVVVESRERGGSMHTVAEAARRDVPVMAVPGPVRSPASAGTNRLLGDGAAPVCDTGDVLVALGLSPGIRRPAAERRVPPDDDAGRVLDALGWQPRSLEQLVAATALSPGVVALALHRLVLAGWVAADGPWWERVGR